jgi:hypothetical protein
MQEMQSLRKCIEENLYKFGLGTGSFFKKIVLLGMDLWAFSMVGKFSVEI